MPGVGDACLSVVTACLILDSIPTKTTQNYFKVSYHLILTNPCHIAYLSAP
ncbi:hypothetical protein I79_014946 [Cricetulus griseus]|uniref:Uncharacterized protein n=1 Tax=Cricetulus griseus TaxID=10029 RepID=G3HVF9_CRIGR|nr:hypothetical protein I79_014946 [Cricetulus griseus]